MVITVITGLYWTYWFGISSEVGMCCWIVATLEKHTERLSRILSFKNVSGVIPERKGISG